MGKRRSPDRDKAKEIYLDHKGNIPLVEIANRLNLSEGTIRGWKAKDLWDKELGGELKSKDKKNTERSNQNTERSKKNMKRSNQDKELKTEDTKLIVSVAQDNELTDKQRLFCLCYVKNFNATQAAINAGYTENYPSEIGYQLLQKTTVQTEIKRLKKLKAVAILVEQNDIVERYMKIAFADMNDFVEIYEEQQPVIVGGKVLMTKDIYTGEQVPVTKAVNVARVKDSTLIDGGLISEVSQSKEGVRIKLVDQFKALDWLGRYFMLNPMDKHKIDYDNKKLEFDNSRLEIDKQRISGKVDLDSLFESEDVSIESEE